VTRAGTEWRLVDDVDPDPGHALDAPIDAAGQMACDLALLAGVADGAPPALRFYRWNPPALSLGHFQPDADVDHDACRRLGVEVVRRPTGGRALLHGGDLTYAVALARPSGDAGKVDAVYGYLARGLIAGLARLGVDAAIARHDGPAGPVCFASQQGADLRVGDRKLCGSAQVRRGGAVLQHGSVLLRRLPFDETDLLVAPGGGAAEREQSKVRLRAATVTLEDLGAPTEPREVAAALAAGFADALDLSFISTSRPPEGPRARHLVEVEFGR
jgi:lipoate-protein ligase A